MDVRFTEIANLWLNPGDEIAGCATFHDYIILITKRGRIYRLHIEDRL